jgi:hypothetical protein
MKRIDIPETVTLCDGSVAHLAPVAMNKRFLAFMRLSSAVDADPLQIIEAMLGILGDCIRNGQTVKTGEGRLSDQDVASMLELLPLNFVTDLLDLDGDKHASDETSGG